MENGFKSRRNNFLAFLHTYWKYKIGRVEKDESCKTRTVFFFSFEASVVGHFKFRIDDTNWIAYSCSYSPRPLRRILWPGCRFVDNRHFDATQCNCTRVKDKIGWIRHVYLNALTIFFEKKKKRKKKHSCINSIIIIIINFIQRLHTYAYPYNLKGMSLGMTDRKNIPWHCQPCDLKLTPSKIQWNQEGRMFD